MKKVVKYSFKTVYISSSVILGIIFALVTLAIYTYLLYIIHGNALVLGALGSDFWSFFSRVGLLSQYFPNYPFWNNLEGGGSSLTLTYPILTHTLLVITSKFGHFSLWESYKIWIFLSVLISAYGVFLYAWIRLRIPAVAFLAGIFYILSPITYIFIYEWGFVAESLATMFFPYTFIFCDLFLLNALDGKWSIRTRLYLFFAVSLFAISFLAHPVVGFGTITFLFLYGLALGLIRRRKHIKYTIITSVLVIFVYVLTVAVGSFWLLPFNFYTGISNYYSTRNNPDAAKHRKKIEKTDGNNLDLDIRQVLSFNPPKTMKADEYYKTYNLPEGSPLKPGDVFDDQKRIIPLGYKFRNLSFPFAISILYLVGVLTSFVLWKRRLPQLAIASFILLLIITSPDAIFVLGSYPLSIVTSYLTSWRNMLIPERTLVPFIAAYGAYGIVAMFFMILRFLDKYFIYRLVKGSVLTVTTLVIAISVLYYFRAAPDKYPYEIAYSTETERGRNIRYDNIWRLADPCRNYHKDDPNGYSEFSMCKSDLFKANFSTIFVADSCNKYKSMFCQRTFTDEEVNQWIQQCKDSSATGEVKQVLCSTPLLSDTVSTITYQVYPFMTLDKIKEYFRKNFPQQDPPMPSLFKAIPDDEFTRFDLSPRMVGYDMKTPFYEKASKISSYIQTASLLERNWGYELSTVHLNDPVYNSPKAVSEIAQYFGLKYLVSAESQEVTDKIKAAGYREINKEESLFIKDDAEPIVALANKPKVLVIGDASLRPFELLFKRANFGVIPYDKALLVEGKSYVDDYSLDELKKFESIFLYGYKYHNKGVSWNLLNQYVKDGGRLFIDTGWQYFSADWNAGTTPEFIPVTQLAWTNYGKTSGYRLDSSLIDTEMIDVNGFTPLVYGNDPWGISGGDQLKDWAKPVLTVDGHPLIVGGELGKGKVVWSGMNLMGHIKGYQPDDPEMKLLGTLMDWLLQGNNPENLAFSSDYDAKWVTPDNVKFTFNVTRNSPYYLYFKEAYYPYWKANLVSNGTETPLKIYRAGPGFMLYLLPQVNAGESINLFIQRPFMDNIYKVLSVATVFALFIFIFIPLKTYGYLFNKIRNRLSHQQQVQKAKSKVKKIIPNFSNDFSKEENDY